MKLIVDKDRSPNRKPRLLSCKSTPYCRRKLIHSQGDHPGHLRRELARIDSRYRDLVLPQSNQHLRISRPFDAC